MDKPLISIIMPAYNIEKHIAESISSVQNQTFVDWELIIVDDGSSDNTLGIINSMAKYEPRIHTKHQNNTGVSAARNLGLKYAKGHYITFLDSDDLWHPDFLKIMLAGLTENQPTADLAYCDFVRFTDETRCIKPVPWKSYYDTKNVYHNMLIRLNMHINAVLFKKSILNKTGQFDIGLSRAEDCDFLLKLVKFGMATHIPQELLYYRQRKNSLSSDIDATLACEKRMLESHLTDKGIPLQVVKLTRSSCTLKLAVALAARGYLIKALQVYCKAILTAPENVTLYLLPLRKILISVLPHKVRKIPNTSLKLSNEQLK